MGDKEGKISIVITAKDKTKGAMSSATKSMQGLGKTAVVGAGVAVAAVGAAVVGVAVKSATAFVEFEDQMNEVFTLLPGISEEAMGAMRDDVLVASREMGRLPEEIIPALYQSLSAGVPADNVFEFLDQAHQTSLGGVTELETAVDGISSVVNAYGSDVMTAAEASDLMFTAVRLGKTDMGQLSGSLSQVTPIAAAMGIGFEDVTAGLASITAQGTPTAQAATGLRALFTELGDSGSEVGGIFEEVAGVSFLDFIEGGGSVADVLKILEQEATDSGVPLQDMFGSIKAGVSALQLTGAGMEGFEDNLAAMGDSAGATETAYDTMNSGMARGFEVMQATVDTIMIKVGEAIAPVVTWLSDKLLGAFEDLQPVIDDVLVVVSNFFAKLENGMDPITAIKSAIMGLAGAFGMSDEEVMELGGTLNRLHENLVSARDAIQELWDKVSEILEPVMEAVAQFVSWEDVLMALGVFILTFIVPIIAGFITTLAPIIAVVLLVIGVIALLRNAWENDWGGIQTKLKAVWEETIKPALAQLQEWLEINIPIAIEKLKEFWENVLLPAIEKVWTFISETLIPIFVEIVTVYFENLKTGIGLLADFWTETLLPAIKDVWAFIQDDLMPLFNIIVDFINAAFTLALTALQGLWENVLLPALKLVWGFIEENLLPIIKSLVEFGLEVLKKIVEDLTIVWDTLLLPALKAIWGFIEENLLPILQDLIDKFLEKLQPAIETITGIFDTLKQAVKDVSGAVQKVIGWIQKMIDKINSVSLPWWLTPGSPTPFELGLLGIAGAAKIASREIDKMEGSLGQNVNVGVALAQGGLVGGTGGSFAGSTQTLNRSSTQERIFNLTVITEANAEDVISNFHLMEALAVE